MAIFLHLPSASFNTRGFEIRLGEYTESENHLFYSKLRRKDELVTISVLITQNSVIDVLLASVKFPYT